MHFFRKVPGFLGNLPIPGFLEIGPPGILKIAKKVLKISDKIEILGAQTFFPDCHSGGEKKHFRGDPYIDISKPVPVLAGHSQSEMS